MRSLHRYFVITNVESLCELFSVPSLNEIQVPHTLIQLITIDKCRLLFLVPEEPQFKLWICNNPMNLIGFAVLQNAFQCAVLVFVDNDEPGLIRLLIFSGALCLLQHFLISRLTYRNAR